LVKFSVILMSMFSMPLVCTSSSIPMIYRYGLLILSQRSCTFHSFFLHFWLI
jgi:hypothetical protein